MSGFLQLLVAGNIKTLTVAFVSGSQIFATSGTFSVPSGTTSLTIEIWGGGGGGGQGYSGVGGASPTGGSAGGNSTISALSITAGGGGVGGSGQWSSYCYCCRLPNGYVNGGGGGSRPTVSGPTGSVTQNGALPATLIGGTNMPGGSNTPFGGKGGSPATGLYSDGGIGGAQVAASTAGNDATNYGAGGSGSGGSTSGGPNPPDWGGSGGGGGNAGGYVKYVMTSGIPSSIVYLIGARGSRANYNGTFPVSGYGSSGVIRFTYS